MHRWGLFSLLKKQYGYKYLYISDNRGPTIYEFINVVQILLLNILQRFKKEKKSARRMDA